MKKPIKIPINFAIALALIVAAGLPATATATASAAVPAAMPSSATVLVDGKNTTFDAYSIGGNNYFKLRDIAYVLNGSAKQFAVGWDSANNAISLSSGKRYTEVGGEMTGKGADTITPNPTSSRIYLNNKEVTLTAYNIDGNNYFKLRDIGKTLNFGIDWNAEKRTIAIDTNSRYYDETGNTSYSDSYFGAAQGSLKRLEGRSLIVSIFLSRSKPGWSAAEISRSAEYLRIAAEFITTEGAKYGKKIELIHDSKKNPDLRYSMFYDGDFLFFSAGELDDIGGFSFEGGKDASAITAKVLNDFIEDNIPYLELADKYKTDSICYVVFVDEGEGNSYATPYYVGQTSERYHERETITGATLQSPSVIAHELLHLFSAVDLYRKSASSGVNDALIEYTRLNYKDEIMLSGWSKDSSGNLVYDRITLTISRITAYCIGWLYDIPELTQFPDIKRAVPAAAADRRDFLNGNASWAYSNGTYTGGFENGVHKGYGIYEYTNGSKYEGYWENDRPNGQGTYSDSDGSVYRGNWSNGKLSGQATYSDNKGNVYKGNWINGKMSGQGTYTYSNGGEYIGNFENNKISGQGTLKRANGDTYTGNFADNVFSGQGTYRYSNGSVYTGNFVNGIISGQGTYTTPAGDVYTGSFENGKFTGQGTMKWSSGHEYTGNWENNRQSGQGTMTYPNGTVKTGNWKDGEFLG